MARLGFVQADPIRAPARAQDLILRHRVTGYRAGDLERRFVRLGLDEDFLYAYGFMPPETARLLHPRPDPDAPDQPYRPTGLAADVLAMVRAQGETHPRDLEAEFGRNRAVNAWGGFSKGDDPHALHRLHYHGLLRVARRRDGIRVYAQAAPPERGAWAVFGGADPSPAAAGRLDPRADIGREPARRAPADAAGGAGARAAWDRRSKPCLAGGALGLRDGRRASVTSGRRSTAVAQPDPVRGVRFLAPFDPVVWDRRRFAHFWGWEYRFEGLYPGAETAVRLLRACPCLWRDQVIGWVNAAVDGGQLRLEPGFAGKRAARTRISSAPSTPRRARMAAFLL